MAAREEALVENRESPNDSRNDGLRERNPMVDEGVLRENRVVRIT